MVLSGGEKTMELLPNDVRQHKFSKAMRGYAPEEVDQFLEHVANVLEGALSARREAEDAMHRLETDVKRLRDQEGSLNQVVFAAQSAMTQAREAAMHEIESLRRAAQSEAVNIVQEAEQERKRLEQDLKFVREARRSYVEQFKAFCLAQLKTLEHLETERRGEQTRLEDKVIRRPEIVDPAGVRLTVTTAPDQQNVHEARDVAGNYPPPLVPGSERKRG
jgi:cell division initiation protein